MADSKDNGPEGTPDQVEDWKRSIEAGEVSPQETYKKVSNIALLLSYDLIDKLRFWEKETLELGDEDVVARVEHLTKIVDRVRAAYLDFGEVD